MAILPLPIARVSDQLRTNVALSSITKTQSDLLTVQNQITTGQKVNTPSDDPAAAAIIQQLQKTLSQRATYAKSLQSATSQLGAVDSSLADLTDLVQQAQTIASQNVGSDVSADQRKTAAALVNNLIGRTQAIGNKEFSGVYLFGGDRSTIAPFANRGAGVQWVGSANILQNDFDENSRLPFTVNGQNVFGALGAQVAGTVNLSPAIAADTRLSDLRGAINNGIAPGGIRLNNGTTAVDIDLSSAGTVGDVVNAINAVGLSGVTASLGANGIQLAGGGDISVHEIGGGSTAADLGILTTTGGGAGVAVNGSTLNAAITPLTRLSELNAGTGLDLSGITLNNGNKTVSLSFRGATTVEDVLNTINGSKSGVLARINSDGTGIDIVNATQETVVRISENGGTTAAQLGVRSFTPATALASLNGGAGVNDANGSDFQITRANGSTFSVDITGLQTVQDVVNAINAADGGGGVTAGFAQSTNGIVLSDSTGGGGTLAVSALNGSSAVRDLGLVTPAVGTTITGSDVNPVSSTGIFANLGRLRDALNNNDPSAITNAAQGLEGDHARVVLVRGETGAQTQDLQARQTQIDDETLATKTLLSNLQDTDLTTAITKYQSLQTALQAGYKMTAIESHMSLLDFLA